jgi:hypothetical protein
MRRHTLMRCTSMGWLGLPWFGLCLASGLLTALPFNLRADEIAPADRDFFEAKIRPILIDQCQSCHGEKQQKGGLRLDSRADLLKGGDSGPAVEGTDLASLLVEVVEYAGDYKMPPKAKLPEEQIASIREWVRRGAPWPDSPTTTPGGKKVEKVFDLAARKAAHWSFQPLAASQPPSPAVPADWIAGNIDRYLAAKWQAESLAPAPLADKATLLRRVTFDLTGLPPSVAELDAFLADASPNAWEKVVDRLLASPRYGERWARRWLDLARFAETAGHEFDFEMPLAFEYRDYVIRAFNADLPYDQFVREQVAGDLLPQPRLHPEERFNESVIGTGFWFLGESKHSPVDIRGDEAERVDNQIDVFGKTFLGLTLGCARCHDHKFDAISTKDYYALCGFVQSARYDVACVDDPTTRREILNTIAASERGLRDHALKVAQEQKLAEQLRTRLLAASRAIRSMRDDALPQAEAVARSEKDANLPAGELANWVEELVAAEPQGLQQSPLRPLAKLLGSERLDAARWQAFHNDCREATRRHDEWMTRVKQAPWAFAGWTTTGEAFDLGWQTGWITAPADIDRFVAPPMFDRVVSSRSRLPEFQGTFRSPTFEIRDPFLLYLIRGEKCRINLIIDGFQQIRNPIYGGLTIPINDPNWRWHAQDVSKWIGHRAYIELIDDGDGGLECGEILPALSPQAPTGIDPLAVALGRRAEPLTNLEDLTTAVTSYWTERGDIPALRPLPGTLRSLLATEPFASERATLAGAPRSTLAVKVRYHRKVMALADGTPENEKVHLRGNHRKLGDSVPRRMLEAFVGNDVVPEDAGTGRLRLAQQLVDPTVTPILPRVIVNRLWQNLFGEGIAATPDDFGNMGQAPTHPELLDYLAHRLIASGWSLKAVQREIALSRAYRQSSRNPDANVVERDAANLALTRARVRRLEAEAIRDAMLAVSGRLVERGGGRGTMPHLSPFMVGRGRPGGSGPVDGDGRRSVYQNIRRNFLNPFLLVFDAPVPFATIGRRSASNVPAQALALLNNPFVLDQASVWGQKVATQSGTTAEKVDAMYRTAFARPPSDVERQTAATFVDEQLASGTSPQSVWTELAHVLFNVKEFIYLE